MMRNENIQCVWKGLQPTPEQLEQIINDHNAWFYSKEETIPPHNLSGIKLRKANLNGVNLSKVDLSGADLAEADLEYAILANASLKGAQMQKTKLNKACLKKADLRDADLEWAKLHKTNLEDVNLKNANLGFAELLGANLQRAHLEGVMFETANLEEANLMEAHMHGAQLRGASMNRAILVCADLKDAVLSVARLNDASLLGAQLDGISLNLADISNANVAGVSYSGFKSCRGIRAETCYGSPRFKRHVMDMDYIEELRESKWGWLYYPWLITSNCGRSLLLWAAWALGLALLFAFVYWGFFEGSFKVPGGELSFGLWTMTYYSVVTFTTLGFGDVTPLTTGASVLVTIEVILGYLMLGGLISIFANKFARRAG